MDQMEEGEGGSGDKDPHRTDPQETHAEQRNE